MRTFLRSTNSAKKTSQRDWRDIGQQQPSSGNAFAIVTFSSK